MRGLVLEGGGVRGAFQAGAYKALQEEGIVFDGVAGTSIGAINGAMIAAGDFDKAYDYWINLSLQELFGIDDKAVNKVIKMDLSLENLGYIFQEAAETVKRGGLDGRLLKEKLRNLIDEEKIRSSGCDFGLVTVDLTGGIKPLELTLDDIPEGELVDYIMASSRLPAFNMYSEDGKTYLDGGFYNNLPFNILTDRGYDELVIIRVYGGGIVRRLKDTNVKTTVIEPSGDLGSVLEFTHERIMENINMGYYDTLRLYRGLKGGRYYIKPVADDNWFFEFFRDVDEEKVLKIGRLMGYAGIPFRRMMFEKIMPRLFDMFSLPADACYGDLVIRLLEEMAEEKGVPRYEVYDFAEFFRLSQWEGLKKGNKKLELLPQFLLKQEFVTRMIKKEILEEIASVIWE